MIVRNKDLKELWTYDRCEEVCKHLPKQIYSILFEDRFNEIFYDKVYKSLSLKEKNILDNMPDEDKTILLINHLQKLGLFNKLTSICEKDYMNEKDWEEHNFTIYENLFGNKDDSEIVNILEYISFLGDNVQYSSMVPIIISFKGKLAFRKIIFDFFEDKKRMVKDE